MKKTILLLFLSFTTICIAKGNSNECNDKDKPVNTIRSINPTNSKSNKFIDFDKIYGNCSGQELIDNIQNAISYASKDKIILFNKDLYDFKGKILSISKPVKLSGKITPNQDLSTIGSMIIKTKFNNVNRIFINSDNVHLYNLDIDARNMSKGYGMISFKGKICHGICFFNLKIWGSAAQIYTENGIGMTLQNITFQDFTSLGFASNRKDKIDKTPFISFKNCIFCGLATKVHYNSRGISFDAGNTEYPIIWDLSNMCVDNCIFKRTGIAFSKCRNAQIINSYFTGDNLVMDMIHMEEYTNNILIKGNTFEHIKPARGFYIDREQQPATNIKIVDNTFKGNYGWIISSYSPSDLIFENNDFTNATPSGKVKYAFDFEYTRNAKEKATIAMDFPSHNITIRNNKGITANAGLNIYLDKNDKNSVIDFPNPVIKRINDAKPIFKPGKYYIKNKKDGHYIAVGKGEKLIANKQKNEKALWEINFVYPQNFSLKSVSTGNYMESLVIFTLNDVKNPERAPKNTNINQCSDYKGKDRIPDFLFYKPKNTKGNYFIIYPGGNERKSCLGNIDGEIKLNNGRVAINDNAESTDDKNLWELIKAE